MIADVRQFRWIWGGAKVLRVKVQPFQTEAAEAVADCFQGQPLYSGLRDLIDPSFLCRTEIIFFCCTSFSLLC